MLYVFGSVIFFFGLLCGNFAHFCYYGVAKYMSVEDNASTMKFIQYI